ncbi:MAG: PIN domain-containing protein [Chlamydiales bacterium]
MMFDTDVLTWYFRCNNKARKIIHSTENISISAVTMMELIQGVKNKQELYVLRKFLSANEIKILYINNEIDLQAIYLLEEYVLSDGMQLADALIASTSLHYGEEILTANMNLSQ